MIENWCNTCTHENEDIKYQYNPIFVIFYSTHTTKKKFDSIFGTKKKQEAPEVGADATYCQKTEQNIICAKYLSICYKIYIGH